MYLKSITTTFVLAITLLSTQVAAGLLTLETYNTGLNTPDTIGGFAMSNFAMQNDTLTGVTASINSPISGAIEFQDRYFNSLDMTRRTADTTSWWNNGESSNYDVFTTGENLIRILLPENTRAFSFNVGANLNSTSDNAWLTAEGYSQNSNELGNIQREYFNVNKNNTPGFGIYADNSNGNCGVISSIVVDPEFWGIGNFSISQSECSTTVSVTEPGSLALLGLGLLCLGAVRHRA